MYQAFVLDMLFFNQVFVYSAVGPGPGPGPWVLDPLGPRPLALGPWTLQAPDLCIFTTVSYGLWLWIYAFLRPCPMVCGSRSMHFYDRVLWSVALDLCIFTTASYGLWLWIYAFLRPCPLVCGSGSRHFYDRVLWSVALDLCIFATVS